MKNPNLQVIMEILAEGGGVSIYRFYQGDDKYRRPKYLYHWTTSEMGLEDKDPGVMTMLKERKTSFVKVLDMLVKKYPGLFQLHCEYVHPEYRLDVTQKIRKMIRDNQLKISEMYSIESWLQRLDIPYDDLTDDAPFDAEEFVEKISDLANNYLNILVGRWTILSYKHSDFEDHTILSKYLEKRNKPSSIRPFSDIDKAGIYMYFIDDKCLYIGKAKKIKNRLLDHYKSARQYPQKNPKNGKRQREMFSHYLDEKLTVFYLQLDDKYETQTGELLRKTFEGILQLQYKPEFDEKLEYKR